MLRAAPSLRAVLLAAASVVGVQSSVDPDLVDWANNTAGRQKWTVELNSTNKQRVVCVHHKPLRVHLSLSVLELFLVQRISTNSSSQLDLSPASEDTWLEGAVGGLDPLPQRERSWESARQEESWLRSLRAAASWVGTAVTTDSADRWSQDFSPFSSSCVALRLRPGAAEAAVEVEAKLVGPMLLSNGHRSIGADQVEAALWLGPAVAVAALLLFWHAPALSRSLLFHYASGATRTLPLPLPLPVSLTLTLTCSSGPLPPPGVTIAMVLGVALLLYVVVRRVSPSRGGSGTLLALATGWAGTLYAAVRQLGWRLVAEHWPAVLAYLGVFGLLGYAVTFWRLKGGRPEAYQSELLAQAMRLAALLALLFSSSSVRASSALLLTVLLAWGLPAALPRGLMLRALRLVGRVGELSGLSLLGGGGGKEVPMWWMPPTASGAYLTQEQFEHRSAIATDNGLRELVASPEYQGWLLRNHRRMRLDDDEDAQPCSDIDD